MEKYTYFINCKKLNIKNIVLNVDNLYGKLEYEFI